MPNWDYGSNSSYFITINTADHTCYFGDIIDNKMNHSCSGRIAEDLWKEIPVLFSYAKIDSFVIMPNHIHGIITIDKPSKSFIDFKTLSLISALQIDKISAQHGGITGMKNPMLNDNISRIIRWFKGRCSFEIHKIDKNFQWQSRFHDRLIRTPESYGRISRYIENNPANWKKNKWFKK